MGMSDIWIVMMVLALATAAVVIWGPEDVPASTSRKVMVQWDAEGMVWVAQSADVPGLVTEAASLDALMEKLQVMVSELLEENGVASGREARRPFQIVVAVGARA
jgi:predicted RNase H-like HicB family nuclease